VIALEPGPALPAPATPTAPGAPVCRVGGDKLAAPSRILMGQTVTVTLTLRADCPPPPDDRADVVLLLGDLSYGDGSEQRDREQTQALVMKRLVRGADPWRVRFAVFQEGHGPHAGLTSHRDTVLAAIDRVGQRWPYQEPADWASHFGFEKAVEHLATAGRPGARKLIVFGMRRQPPDYAFYLPQAAAARAAGVRVIVVNFDSPPHATLSALVAEPADLVDWREAATTDVLFTRVGGPETTGGVRDVVVDDELYRDVRLVPGSAAPAALERPGALAWHRARLPAAGLTLSYRILPQRAGRYPANARAVADYTDADGARRQFVFPAPELLVIAPTPTAGSPGERTPTPRPTATGEPRPVYLPLALRDECIRAC
jgi:hypothetical protein